MRQNESDNLKTGNWTFLIRITRVQNEIGPWNGIRRTERNEPRVDDFSIRISAQALLAFLRSFFLPPPSVKNETRFDIYFSGNVNTTLYFLSFDYLDMRAPRIRFGQKRFIEKIVRFTHFQVSNDRIGSIISIKCEKSKVQNIKLNLNNSDIIEHFVFNIVHFLKSMVFRFFQKTVELVIIVSCIFKKIVELRKIVPYIFKKNYFE